MLGVMDLSTIGNTATSTVNSLTSTVSSVATGLNSALSSFSSLASLAGLDGSASAVSQKADIRPISFVLDDESGGTFEEITLQIRPEELTVGFPSKLTVNQTLNGGWVDSFGEGLEEGSFSGTLGWRASLTDNGGIERMINFKQLVYSGWHAKRAAAIARGDDPTKVKLFLLDSLNNYGREIAPKVFDLKRSKSRPLLAMYRFNFVMLSRDLTGSVLTKPDETDNSSWFSSLTSTAASWIDSLTSSIGAIWDKLKSAYQWVDTNVIAPIKKFVAATSRLLTTIKGVVTSGLALVGQVIRVARLATAAAVNIFSSLSLVASIPNIGKASLSSVAREYRNLYCLLANAKVSAATYEDYDSVYGASNCSSTAGGSAISSYASTSVNTFASITATRRDPVTVSAGASSSLSTLANVDLVTTSLPPAEISAHLDVINNGMVVA